MAGINFKDGPGGRMKRAQQAQVLRVSSPNDPRLRAYQDSLNVHNLQNIGLKEFEQSKKLTPAQRTNFWNGAPGNTTGYNVNNPLWDSIWRLNIPHKDLETSETLTGLGLSFHKPKPFPTPQRTVIYEKPKPKRTVISTPRPAQPVIERMAPRQAMPPEIVAPAMRPMPMPVPVQQLPPMIEEAPVVPQEAAPAVVRRGPKAIMPTRQGGWSNQPLLMKMFPKLYAK